MDNMNFTSKELIVILRNNFQEGKLKIHLTNFIRQPTRVNSLRKNASDLSEFSLITNRDPQKYKLSPKNKVSFITPSTIKKSPISTRNEIFYLNSKPQSTFNSPLNTIETRIKRQNVGYSKILKHQNTNQKQLPPIQNKQIIQKSPKKNLNLSKIFFNTEKFKVLKLKGTNLKIQKPSTKVNKK